MGRLTKRINGIWDVDRDAGYNSLDCAEKLAHYEDMEEMGYRMVNIDKVVEQLDKLQASETPEWNDGYYSAIYEAIEIVKGGKV